MEDKYKTIIDVESIADAGFYATADYVMQKENLDSPLMYARMAIKVAEEIDGLNDEKTTNTKQRELLNSMLETYKSKSGEWLK